MEGKTLARIAAAVFAGVAITATAIEITRKDDRPANPVPAVIAPAAPDPLRVGQRRCQRLGEAGARDAECLRVWSESRDRFLGFDRQRPTSANDDPVTKQTAPADMAGER
ncbi:putative entry exclusion protein TrbK-alt [Novosphingobium sp. RL4]|uniref:putative entry exclusion protein TrbK-alt n=1 Tax=Novosphingobium sp. RL4 TaxID=3109595 RepID=UPI002D76BDC7|nr:putative entry exclusion protein TrbK-alt [Novosphingobium sp. RL4]WRT91768.1 putative entry exclusion protein TrbK-alt [Novosphingobium sp. RL4]